MCQQSEAKISSCQELLEDNLFVGQRQPGRLMPCEVGSLSSVYPIIYRFLNISLVVSRISEPSTVSSQDSSVS